AFYFWLRECFKCDVIVHVGKHGNLEWLPGKSVALSNTCWPDVLLGPMPHLYPFIVNDPGEGSQAKRRSQAVIIDHLMPPLTRAETYGQLQDLERQVDEYYEALVIDPRRADMLRSTILANVISQNLHQDLGIGRPENAEAERALLMRTDAYLCDLKESQIRDGLHVFGRSPGGTQRRDTLLALARFAVGDGKAGNAGLLAALSLDLELEGFNPFDSDWTQEWSGARPALLSQVSDSPWRHNGDTRERLEKLASILIEQVAPEANAAVDAPIDISALPRTRQVLERLQNRLRPALDGCGTSELHGLRAGLSGRFVRSGPSGAPSRGRPDVLPTGKNFYSVDTRAVPTPTAWRLGFASAAQMIERYLQEHGDYPRTIGISVWGTATMRTGGDDIAQALALMGVRPVWAQGSYRVADFEILPVSILDRPRIDVTLRVSGFFRDAFTNVIELFDAAVQAVAELQESEQDNFVRARILRDTQKLVDTGTEQKAARAQAGWRVFGSKPGAYGAGLQSLIDSGNWSNDADLADAYCAWGGYAYGRGVAGVPAVARFNERLAAMQLVVQNQDNREHDVLDSNDYYQFHGGMSAAVRHLSGIAPVAYHADHSNPEAPRIRTLREEIGRVIRSRVVNPKWIAGVKRHGYKGAFEIADTVDYLFAFDATAHVLSDYQYALVADAFVNDADTREFLLRHNANAMHDICERLLEAIERELWESPGEFESMLRQQLLDTESQLEAAS
ncbi:cobaltochelatase subunit CobN, partial [Steroidobacter sp.]|uniref:cobaltochelatase subunit CobN n=1 Tax=Steroidobacter sp. TaxID=1978227 RepID=UPI001A4D325A